MYCEEESNSYTTKTFRGPGHQSRSESTDQHSRTSPQPHAVSILYACRSGRPEPVNRRLQHSLEDSFMAKSLFAAHASLSSSNRFDHCHRFAMGATTASAARGKALGRGGLCAGEGVRVEAGAHWFRTPTSMCSFHSLPSMHVLVRSRSHTIIQLKLTSLDAYNVPKVQ